MFKRRAAGSAGKLDASAIGIVQRNWSESGSIKMAKAKYTVYIPEFRSPEKPQRDILEPHTRIVTHPSRDQTELIRYCSNADAVLVTMNTNMSAEIIRSCPRLKVIGKYGVGLENIHLATATQMGIPVTNVPAVNSNATAELTVGLMLSVLRRIQPAMDHVRRGGWKNDPRYVGFELAGRTVGVIGYGNVAKNLIRKLKGFDLKQIYVFSESRAQSDMISEKMIFTDLMSLMARSDIVTIHKSMTEAAKGLIGEKEIAAMKPTAFLINTSRGGLVRESALIQALSDKKIAGAALDVFDSEPLDSQSPLLRFDNVVVTPHIGGATHEARKKMVTVVANNLLKILNGQPVDLKYICNPEVQKKNAIKRR